MRKMRQRVHACGSSRKSCVQSYPPSVTQMAATALNRHENKGDYSERRDSNLQREYGRISKSKHRDHPQVLRKRTAGNLDAYSVTRSGVHFVPRRDRRHLRRWLGFCRPPGNRFGCAVHLPWHYVPDLTSPRGNGRPCNLLRQGNRPCAEFTRYSYATMGWLKNLCRTQFAVYNHAILRSRTPDLHSGCWCISRDLEVRILLSVSVEPLVVGRLRLHLARAGALSKDPSFQNERPCENARGTFFGKLSFPQAPSRQHYYSRPKGNTIKGQKGFHVAGPQLQKRKVDASKF